MFKTSTLLGGLLLVSTTTMVPVMAKAQNSGVSVIQLCTPGTLGCAQPNRSLKGQPQQKIPEGYYRDSPNGASNGGRTNQPPKVDSPIAREISCRDAQSILRKKGYRHVQTVFCGGSHYTFRARQNWRNYIVVIRKSDGAIVSTSRA